MSGTFVVRLSPESNPPNGMFMGWVEVVDSGEEFRFHSTDELMGILARGFLKHTGNAANEEP